MSEVAVKDNVETLPMALPEGMSTIDGMLMIAVQRGATVDEMRALYELKREVDADEARRAFVVAMSEFRKVAPTIGKNKPGHNSKYASLDNITDTVNPLLSKQGLSYAWVTEQGDAITVHCDVTHVGGHSQRVSLSAGADNTGNKNDIQAIGSAVSYLQRYTLLSALGLATGGDDDGNAAGKKPDPLLNELQLRTINEMLDEHNLRGGFEDWLKKGGINSVEEMPNSWFDKSVAMLKKRIESAGS